MRTVAFAAIAALALVSPAVAADKISNRQAMEVLQGLRALDGHQVIAKSGGNETVVTQPWEFGSGVLRLKIANDIAILAAVERSVTDARNAAIREINGGAEVKAGTPEMDQLLKQLDQILDQPANGTQDLARIKDAELKLDKNEIPSTVLAAIAPIRDPN
jgi:2',3'-cyclic-nucleotide 2'-phosphodiesterase (5'-nucleotidase family)